MASSYVSELRIVLLGKDSSEISRVGNFILRQKAFDSEAPPSSVKQHNETAGGMVEGRYITLINTPHLLDPQLSPEELNQRVRECVHLCSPGPHVFLLVLQSENFTEQDCETIRNALEYFSPFSLEYTIVLITKSKKQRLSYCENNEPEKNKNLQQLISTCRGGSEKIKFDKAQVLQLLKKITKMVEGSRGHLTCQFNEPQTVKYSAASGRGQPQSVEKGKRGDDAVKEKKRGSKKNEGSPRLNLVVCGSDGSVKSSVSDLILDQRELSSDSSSVCLRREAEVCGRLISLVELPALYSSQLSEEEVMRETLRCVSLCDPGVHAFLFILPEGRLTDEDKEELEKIQMIFGSSFNNHTISVINTESQHQSVELDKATKEITETFKRHCVCVLDSSMESVLINEVDLMLKLNSGSCYTSSMYLTAQVETQLKYKTEIEELRETIRLLSIKKETQESFSHTGYLRIVLMGKTGVGKSATGNTILRKEVFRELSSSKSVTSICQKESAEVSRRRVTVIDTPGLFDTSISNEEIIKEIAKCITMAAPGPHVFLLVLTVGRFTQEEKDAVKMIQDRFGEESSGYTIVLFTRGDDLRKMSIDDHIKHSDHSLQNIINQCGNRYHVFNNRNTEDQTQVTDLLEKIDCMVAENGGSCYTNEMFQKTERALREEQERILKEKKEEIEREKAELRAKHEAELEKLKKMMTEEQQNLVKERKEKEEEFQKREAQIKEETNEERKKELDKKLKEERKAFNKKMERKEQAYKEKIEKDQRKEKETYEREKANLIRLTEEKSRNQAEKNFNTAISLWRAPIQAVAETVDAVVDGVGKLFSKLKFWK